MELVVVTAYENASTLLINKIVNFVYRNQVGTRDNLDSIFKSVDYALSPFKYQGGFILIAQHQNNLTGAVVINRTNMEGYNPRNLMTYLAIDSLNTVKGLDKKLLNKAIEITMGDLACHISIDSPMIGLFEEVGFEKNYFELRMKK